MARHALTQTCARTVQDHSAVVGGQAETLTDLRGLKPQPLSHHEDASGLGSRPGFAPGSYDKGLLFMG